MPTDVPPDLSPEASKRAEGKRISLTVSTLSGDYTHAYAEHSKLQHVVDRTIEELELTGEGTWILESTAQSSLSSRRSLRPSSRMATC